MWSSYTYLQEHKELEGPGKEIKDTGSVATHVAKVCNALCIPRFKKKKRERNFQHPETKQHASKCMGEKKAQRKYEPHNT